MAASRSTKGVDALTRNYSLIDTLLFLLATQQRVDRLHHCFIGIIFARSHNHVGIMLHHIQIKLGVLV